MIRVLPALALLVLPVSSHAIVTTRIVLVLGAEVTHPPSSEAVKAAGLEAFTTPSVSWTGDKRTPRHVVGRVLGEMTLDRGGPEQVGVPVPSAEDVAHVKAALATVGVSAAPQVFAIVEQSGGK